MLLPSLPGREAAEISTQLKVRVGIGKLTRMGDPGLTTDAGGEGGTPGTGTVEGKKERAASKAVQRALQYYPSRGESEKSMG